MIFIPPDSKGKLLSIIFLVSMLYLIPNPSHFTQAPLGELKEKLSGSRGVKETLQSKQARCSLKWINSLLPSPKISISTSP